MSQELRRLALLIGGKDLTGKDRVKGLEKDLYDFSKYLTGERGGAWEDGEIKFLLHPSKKLVKDWLAHAEHAADYCVIVYGGHGCHYKEPLNESCICLSDDEEMMVRELNPRTQRHLVMLDTCRKLTNIEEQRSEKIAGLSFSDEVHPGAAYRASCRSLFDSALRECETGRCVGYGCDRGQAAGDDDRGGYFTQSMLFAAKTFHDAKMNKWTANEVQDLSTSFRIAHARVQTVNYPQNPVLEQGRRLSSFPFSVR